MTSVCGRFLISYNGEVYNFRELRKELEKDGFRFRGHSDTEVLLGAITEWGLEKTLQQIIGMYALALWDREQESLTLVRDPVGKNPCTTDGGKTHFSWIRIEGFAGLS